MASATILPHANNGIRAFPADLAEPLARINSHAPAFLREEAFARLEEMMSRPRPEPAVGPQETKADEA